MSSTIQSVTRPVHAVYRTSGIPALDGNPLIEALPPIKSDEEWLEQLLSLPTFDARQREAVSYIRGYHLVQVKDLFVPGEQHLTLGRRVDQLIRWGYRKRNPLLPERAELLQMAYERAQGGGASKVTYSDQAPICSHSIMGVSGMGKSTSTEAVLGAYPQYIFHPEHHIHQLVWLKVDTPKDGSIRELALDTLRALDRALGTSAARTVTTRMGPEDIMHIVEVHAITHNLGILVLDELQNLSVKRSGGRESMLNWFQELVNTFRLPILLLGTFKARSVLQLDMRHARRNAAMGSAEWKPLPREALQNRP